MKKNIIYTNSAQKKLDSVISKLKLKIEEDIRESKNYPGEEFIEITASDIEETFERISIRSRMSKINSRNRMIKLILPVYFLLGLLTIIYGFFYSEIQNLITNDPKRLQIVLVGFIISLTTGAMYYLLRQKEFERNKELLNYRLEREKEIFENRINIIGLNKEEDE